QWTEGKNARGSLVIREPLQFGKCAFRADFAERLACFCLHPDPFMGKQFDELRLGFRLAEIAEGARGKADQIVKAAKSWFSSTCTARNAPRRSQHDRDTTLADSSLCRDSHGSPKAISCILRFPISIGHCLHELPWYSHRTHFRQGQINFAEQFGFRLERGGLNATHNRRIGSDDAIFWRELEILLWVPMMNRFDNIHGSPRDFSIWVSTGFHRSRIGPGSKRG